MAVMIPAAADYDDLLVHISISEECTKTWMIAG
jgi:hypothetical protein